MVLERNNQTTCPTTSGVELLISLDASFCKDNIISFFFVFIKFYWLDTKGKDNKHVSNKFIFVIFLLVKSK